MGRIATEWPSQDHPIVLAAREVRDWQRPKQCTGDKGCWVDVGPQACSPSSQGAPYCLECEGNILQRPMRDPRWVPVA